MNYLNTETGQYPISEREIRALHANVSFPEPFAAPEPFAPVFAAPAPEHDPITQGAREIAPALTDKGHYEQRWEVYPLDAETVAANRARQRAERTAAIAARRYEREIAGILWRGYGIATDRESQAKIDTEERATEKGLRVDGKGWKCVDLSTGTVTFRPTTNAEMQEIATAAYGYVSACFAREEALLFALDAGDYSDSMLATGWPSQQVG